ncbi:hypothetical protein LJC15_04150 [Desulfovibrio sp. OttesenSCG-928-G11]|nr:hypothetical protein [Desulfovibrio sp. OttesenSCG-928-G11]
MINMRIFEQSPALSGPVPARSRLIDSGKLRPGAAPLPGMCRATLAMGSLFALLERLKLCHGPRILSAECVLDNTMNHAAPVRRS